MSFGQGLYVGRGALQNCKRVLVCLRGPRGALHLIVGSGIKHLHNFVGGQGFGELAASARFGPGAIGERGPSRLPKLAPCCGLPGNAVRNV